MQVILTSSPQANKTSAIAAFFIGLFIIALSPFIPGLVVVLMTVLVLLVSVILVITGISLRGTGLSLILILLGITGCIIGGSILAYPRAGLSILGILLGIWMILLGGTHIGYASSISSDRWNVLYTVAAGIACIMMGLYLLFAPAGGLSIITIFIGCYLIAWGIMTFFRKTTRYMDADFTIRE